MSSGMVGGLEEGGVGVFGVVHQGIDPETRREDGAARFTWLVRPARGRCAGSRRRTTFRREWGGELLSVLSLAAVVR